MKISQNHNNNASITYGGKPPQGQRRNLSRVTNETKPVVSKLNNSKSTILTISEEAKERLMQHRAQLGEESNATARQRQAVLAFAPIDTDENNNTQTNNDTGANSGSVSLSGSPFLTRLADASARHFTNESDLIELFAHEFWSILGESSTGDYTNLGVVARQRLTTLANVYAEIRHVIEKRYSGEELEERLRWLSQGFDILANDVAQGIANFAERFFNYDEDNSGMSDAELERLRLRLERFFPGMKDIVLSLAQMFRQYAVENGLIISDRSAELFDKFLQTAENPSGGALDKDLGAIEKVELTK